MFGWLGRLFGTEKASEKVIESLSNGLDKMVYTDEEKSDTVAADRSEARNMFIRWVESTQGSNLARRFIALVVTGIWALQYTVSMIMLAVVPWVDNPDKWTNSAHSISTNGEAVTGAMMLVLAFYFSGQYIGNVVNIAMNKFNKGVGDAQKKE